MEKHSLKFYQLSYQVSDILHMIGHYSGIDNFVFSYYSAEPGLPLQLAAYVRTCVGDVLSYSKDFDVLAAQGYSILEVTGPVILSNNFITIEVMNGLINSLDNPDGEGYLVFTPALNDKQHVYYDVVAYNTTDDIELQTGGTSTTNPSPPATMAVTTVSLV